MRRISDLACELLRRRPKETCGVESQTKTKNGTKTTITKILTATAANRIGKPQGTYINIQTKEQTAAADITKVLAAALREQITGKQKILVVGLGNDKFVADSLGPKALTFIDTGANLMTFEPNVGGITGINSVDAIRAISKLASPTVVIVIDSLVAGNANRIGNNYQIADSGITPGSGIGRANKRIDSQFLGVPVIAIGIPVCTILTPKTGKIMHVVPKDIDAIIARCSYIIASAINAL